MVTTRFLIDGREMTPDEASRWLIANGMGENQADSADDEFLERASGHVSWCLRSSDEARQWIVPVWDMLESMLRCNTNFVDQPVGSDIHVPKLFSKVEALVPLLMDAASGANGEMLRCEGRDAGDRRRAIVIQEWLRYGLDQCNINGSGEDAVRSAVIYGLFAFHTWWDLRYAKRMRRKLRQHVKDGKLFHDISREEVEDLIYEGMRFRLIHPRNLIVDPRETDVRRMGFVGEVQTRVPVTELLNLEAQGIYSGVAAALEPSNQRARGALQASIEEYRSTDRRHGQPSTTPLRPDMMRPGSGTPDEVDVVSLWGQWSDLKDPQRHEDFGEWQFVYVNGSPVRIAKNPYEEQHRPYAVARISKDPFNFYAVSPAMAGTRLNAELDQHRAYAARGHALAIAPVTWDETGSLEMPRNLLEVEPGTVIAGQGTVGQLKMPSVMADAIAMDELVNRDMADAMGVLDAFLGRDDAGTATESNNNLRQARNRIRRQVDAIADGFRQLAQHYLLLSRQFITTRKTFRVLGKRAGRLGFASVSPEDLLDPVDIIMVGPEQLATYGARATQINTFMTAGATLLQTGIQDGVVQVGPLLRELYQGIMGTRLGDEILRDDLNPDDVLPQEHENVLLMMGQRVEVHELDDDAAHLAGIDEFLTGVADASLTEDAKREFYLHAQAHRMAYERKQVRSGARQRALENAPAQQGASQGLLGDGKKKPGDGNEHQPTPDLRADAAGKQTPPRQANGPADPRRMARPDRSQAVPQSE